MEQDMGYQRLQPHIETLLQWYWTTTNHYHFWLIELARRFATQQYYDAMHRPGESWCGSTAAIPPAILTDLQQQGMQAGLDIITWLNDTETHKVHLVEVHDAIQDALRDPTLSPYERTLLRRCTAELESLDLNNPTFKPLAYPAPPPSQNDSRWQRIVRRMRRAWRIGTDR
jgi:hypothetical protein